MAANNPLVTVMPSPIHGEGLFAAVDLSAGQRIGYYEGPVVVNDGRYVLWIEEEEENVWTGYEGINCLRFLNHSDTPNAEMYGRECYALAAISAGQEITIDYGWEKA
jgi:hypothetical protein